MSGPPAVGAIDIGTNSVKMLVKRGGDCTYETRTVSLGAGMQGTKKLQPDAIARTLQALREYRLRADALGVARLAVVATSATRDAGNREEFLDSVAEILGVRPIVLTGNQEGRLALFGSRQNLPEGLASPQLLLDIGGGSTELVLGADEMTGVCSIDVGSVRLTESHLRNDPPRAYELSNAIGHVLDHLDDVLREMPEILDAASIIGIGGTIKTVAAVEIGRTDSDQFHGFWLSRDAVEDVFRTLATESLADRAHNPGLPADRAPIIVGGLCVLVAVLRKLKSDGLTVSRCTVADGICAALERDSWPMFGDAS